MYSGQSDVNSLVKNNGHGIKVDIFMHILRYNLMKQYQPLCSKVLITLPSPICTGKDNRQEKLTHFLLLLCKG